VIFALLFILQMHFGRQGRAYLFTLLFSYCGVKCQKIKEVFDISSLQYVDGIHQHFSILLFP